VASKLKLASFKISLMPKSFLTDCNVIILIEINHYN
jgi:hypothetical protein